MTTHPPPNNTAKRRVIKSVRTAQRKSQAPSPDSEHLQIVGCEELPVWGLQLVTAGKQRIVIAVRLAPVPIRHVIAHDAAAGMIAAAHVLAVDTERQAVDPQHRCILPASHLQPPEFRINVVHECWRVEMAGERKLPHGTAVLVDSGRVIGRPDGSAGEDAEHVDVPLDDEHQRLRIPNAPQKIGVRRPVTRDPGEQSEGSVCWDPAADEQALQPRQHAARNQRRHECVQLPPHR
mmetsp:Transcript_1268/g.3287  ORF Transcript_1268/g.3287 Transcript_1268/m.3287 type:complete len:235 (-) Transcript_1268:400-1104(-)